MKPLALGMALAVAAVAALFMAPAAEADMTLGN